MTREGQYIARVSLDGHIYVESSMMTMTEYARAMVPHGTTGLMNDRRTFPETDADVEKFGRVWEEIGCRLS